MQNTKAGVLGVFATVLTACGTTDMYLEIGYSIVKVP